jgi:hypothetical protein
MYAATRNCINVEDNIAAKLEEKVQSVGPTSSYYSSGKGVLIIEKKVLIIGNNGLLIV